MTYFGGRGSWSGGSSDRSVYLYIDEDRERMGHCDWLPKNGDLCVCLEHSGDCFYDYMAVRKTDDEKYEKVGEFGAYNFGEKLGTLTKRCFHLLCAEEKVELEYE